MIITISGSIGSGKTTLAKQLAETLGYKHYYVGGMRRAMAAERGMTLNEFNAVGEREEWTDRQVDEFQKRIGETENNVIMEGRTSFHMIPRSLKIFIACDERVGAERLFKQMNENPAAREEAPNIRSVEDMLAANRVRIASDKLRYKQYYNIDVYDPKNYDFVLDTTALDAATAFQKLLAFVKKRVN